LALNLTLVTYTRGRDLSGTLAGAGGIGGLLARSRYATSSPYAVNGNSFYHADGNVNVTYLASSSGGTDAAYRYDPFGRWLAQTGPYASANVMRFSSKPWVAHNGSNTDGLHYYGYRFYDPLTQRWPSRDPIGERGGLNLYEFAWNNPVDYFDHFGLFVKPTDYPPADPNDNTIICYNGKLTIQNKNKGPDRKCTGVHEYTHLQDWLKRYGDDVCKGQKNGTTPVGGDGYDEFLRQSECKAYKAGKKCREDLLKNCNEKDRDAIQRGIDRDNEQLKKHKCD
jgi:RHS repeat-associated protein